jgi:hypothetical protein
MTKTQRSLFQTTKKLLQAEDDNHHKFVWFTGKHVLARKSEEKSNPIKRISLTWLNEKFGTVIVMRAVQATEKHAAGMAGGRGAKLIT